ncbi:diguanylate cyclase domain-containing protein [Actinokineospora guangxiensis]|uniref:Diguanylate cyclase domain-containing protein n=1 Tax=Actinokineospora guangxiensis TaxID=1490288 RepID=A0ABW0ETS6_9PSEU
MSAASAESGASARRGREERVRAWLRVIAATVYVPHGAEEIAEFLNGRLDLLAAAIDDPSFDPEVGAVVGAQLVEYGLTGEDTLRRTVALLVEEMLSVGADGERVARLCAALACGYSDALRRRTLEQQENMKLALLSAKQRADRDRRASEDRFRGVFSNAAIGIAVTDPDGRFLEVNPALLEILACTRADLEGRAIGEFVSTEEPDQQSLIGLLDRRPDRRRLVRWNGEAARVYLSTSVVREAGEPLYQVVVVQDLSEVELLQGRLSHQLLHDALTGLANRVHFHSRLETAHGQCGPTDTLTLLCLDLDAFGMVNNTHGHAVGDRLLSVVAERLKRLFADESATVARVGGDEFAVLVRDGSDTPSVPELVEAVQAELGEPEYHGQTGIAVGATIGVVRARRAEMTGVELFRAAEAALRRARATGGRQWAEHDERLDKRARVVGRAATGLPGSWENGDLVVAYAPVARLRDQRTVRVRALPHVPGARRLTGTPTVVELAELTGLSAALGPWLLGDVGPRLPVWWRLFAQAAGEGRPVHRVLLTPLQSADENLAGAVTRAVAESGLAPGLLEIGLDTGAVLASRGDAQDNLRTLTDIGVATALHGFSGGPREVAAVERYSVGTVLLSDPFDGWRPDWLPADAVPVAATRDLVDRLSALDVEVGVLGVRDAAEASWWSGAGVHTGEGPAFGEPTGLEEVVSAAK